MSIQRPRSRAPELYGFVAWTCTTCLYIIYCLWALIPDKWLIAAGIDWYPNREWAILLPAWTIVVVLLTYLTYMAIAIFRTPSFSELCVVVDSHSSFPSMPMSTDRPPPYSSLSRRDALPELFDIPIGLVNRVLYENLESRDS